MSKVLSALLVTLGLLLLTAGQAHAAAQCNQGPINEAGDINIAPSFPDVDCVVAGDVTGGGYIRINAPLGKITITGSITTTNHGNIVLSAGVRSRSVAQSSSITRQLRQGNRATSTSKPTCLKPGRLSSLVGPAPTVSRIRSTYPHL